MSRYPPTLLPAVVAVAERQQRRRTIRTALIAAAAVAVIAVGSAVVAASIGDDDPPVSAPPPAVETTAAPQRMTTLDDGRSTGWVSLTPLPSGGTRVDLTCTYNSSYEGVHDYELVTHSTDGETETKSFKATTGEEEKVTDTTSIELDDIEKVVVTSSYGPILLLTPDRTP